MCSTCECSQTTGENELNLAVENVAQCRKCGSEPFILLDKVHVECKGCFLETCNKKLRSTIGKSKLIRNNDSVLIAHSGGPSSSALLDLIKSSMEYDARREQKFRPSILHVDTNLESTFEDRSRKLQVTLESASRLYPNWPIYWTALELCPLQPDCDTKVLYSKYSPNENLDRTELEQVLDNSDAKQNFSKTLDTLDLTDLQQRVQCCLTDLISQVAKQINDSFKSADDCFKYVFTGSSATQLANNLLVDVILGNGSSIRSTVSICDQRPLVPTLRPMRDFSKKEIAFYLQAKNIQFQPQTNSSTLADKKSSIQKLTESFLGKLYVDYPATYNTLLRTGNKMQD